MVLAPYFQTRGERCRLARRLKPEFGTRTLDVARQGGRRGTPGGDLVWQPPLK